MKPGITLVVSLIAACSLAFSAQAAPPEGKGQGNSTGHPGKGSGNGDRENPHASGNPGKGNSSPGNSGKGGPEMHGSRDNGASAGRGGSSLHGDDLDRRYDDHGRYYDYFDDRRDRHGHLRGDDVFSDLVFAGITAAMAREYALDFGLGGYSSLPPGIRKNLARGKPLPPGIAKQMAPGPLLGRLPRYPGYEWRIAGTDLILISVATAVIADILYDVF